MVMGAADAAVGGMVSVIPVVVTGGVLMKFTEKILPNQRATAGGRSQTRHRKKKDTYSRGYSGDFSNIGF